MEEKTVHY